MIALGGEISSGGAPRSPHSLYQCQLVLLKVKGRGRAVCVTGEIGR